MTSAAEAERNRLLAALPEAELRRWLPQLETVAMQYGQILYEPGVTPGHAWFPTTAIVSLVYIDQGGAPTETAVIGNEGMVGIPLLMGGGSTSGRAVVRSAGGGLRMEAEAITREFTRTPATTHLLLRYMQAQISQIAQTAVCNRHHTLYQQVCRCLLSTLDRSAGNELEMTQEGIAHILGVRREGVTQAALELQSAGVIRYSRGHISVLDRAGLERGACECYAVVRREYDRLLPAKPASAPSETSRMSTLRADGRPRSAMARTSEPDMAG